MASNRQHGYRPPDWPRWVYERFNPRGMRMIEGGYKFLKESSELDRASRMSAADYATSVCAHLLSTGETMFFLTQGPGKRAA